MRRSKGVKRSVRKNVKRSVRKNVNRSVRKNVKKNTRRNQRRVNRHSSRRRVSRRSNRKKINKENRTNRRRTGHNKRNKTNKRINDGGGLGDLFSKCVGRSDPIAVKVQQQGSSPSGEVGDNRILLRSAFLNHNIELAQQELTETKKFLEEVKSDFENPTESQQILLEEATQMVEKAEKGVATAIMEYRNYIDQMGNAVGV